MNNSQESNQSNLVKKGDIYKLGNQFLGCGKAEDSVLLEKMLVGKKINCIAVDPPYGIDFVEGKREFAKLSNQTDIVNDHVKTNEQYNEFTRTWLHSVYPYLASHNSVYIFNSDRMIWSVKQAFEEEGGKFSQLLIWAKNHSVIGRLDYNPQHELILYGWFGKHKFYKSTDKSVLCYPKPQKSKLHPTMKPIPLIRHLILNSTQMGEVVWDGFGGSGTTLIACQQTRRVCIMTEISLVYCQVILDRFKRIFPQLPITKLEP